nr:MAG TPA: hypothetical protein [Caudoviricetes sp.]
MRPADALYSFGILLLDFAIDFRTNQNKIERPYFGKLDFLV